jgi:hypothetical protein
MEFWMSLRHSQQLSARKARQAVTTALTRLITDPSTSNKRLKKKPRNPIQIGSIDIDNADVY